MDGTRIRLIAFDLDGTLVDSVPDLAWALNEMSRELSLPSLALENVREWVGDGVQRLVKRALTGNRDSEPDTALFERGLNAFRRAYRDHLAVDSRLYPGARELLVQLQRSGYRLACITNKSSEFTAPLLSELQLRRYFSIVIAGDSLPERKPSPLPLLHAAHECGVRPAEACMIGDSHNDMLAARAAGFAAVGVSFGYGDGPRLEPRPDAMLASLAELPHWLESRSAGVVSG